MLSLLALALVSFAGALAMAAAGDSDPSAPSEIPVNDVVEAIVNFTLFVFLLYHFGKKPIGAFFSRRRDAIAADIEEAQRLRAEAEAKLAEYTRKIESIDAARKTILDGYRKQGEEERDAIISAAKALSERLKTEAKTAIEYEVKRARAKVKAQVVEEAMKSARASVLSRLDSSTRDRLVDSYSAALTTTEGGS